MENHRTRRADSDEVRVDTTEVDRSVGTDPCARPCDAGESERGDSGDDGGESGTGLGSTGGLAQDGSIGHAVTWLRFYNDGSSEDPDETFSRRRRASAIEALCVVTVGLALTVALLVRYVTAMIAAN